MTDYDSPWKEALDVYFEAFMGFFFPAAHVDIDWSRGYESLDKELQKIVAEGELGRRIVDKLMKVWLKDGREQWLLINVEIQGEEDSEFGQRMYVYNYRIYDRYNREVVSLAILADDSPHWRPNGFGYSRWGFQAGIRFPVVKLLDYSERVEWLEHHSNPFATVILAHLKTRETRTDEGERYAWKFHLIKGLYNRGLSREDIQRLFRFIDWVMDLPRELEEALSDEIQQYEREKQMPYVSTPERVGMRRGLAQGCLLGIEQLLEFKFGEDGLRLMPEIREIHDEERLEAILKAIKTVSAPDDLRQLWTS